MITQDELRELVIYEEETGLIYWRKRRVGCRRNVSAGCLDKKSGYLFLQIKSKKYLAHRVAWVYVNGDIPNGLQIDHIDHDRNNNKIKNLRAVTNSENQKNRKKSIRNSTGVNGVYFDKRNSTYYVQIHLNGKQKSLGAFKYLCEAKKAREDADKCHGYHENHGK